MVEHAREVNDPDADISRHRDQRSEVQGEALPNGRQVLQDTASQPPSGSSGKGSTSNTSSPSAESPHLRVPSPLPVGSHRSSGNSAMRLARLPPHLCHRHPAEQHGNPRRCSGRKPQPCERPSVTRLSGPMLVRAARRRTPHQHLVVNVADERRTPAVLDAGEDAAHDFGLRRRRSPGAHRAPTGSGGCASGNRATQVLAQIVPVGAWKPNDATSWLARIPAC